jgi:hypothetical protein
MEASQEASTQLLKKKYNLNNAPEVTAAADRTEARTGEGVPRAPHDRIQNYLNRFREIIDRDEQDPENREIGINAIKHILHEKNVIKPDQIPESYWETQKRIVRERGQGVDNIDWEEQKRQSTESIIADQKSSLDKWISYLSSKDAPYSDELKYLTLRSVLSMGEYDKANKTFTKRSKGTTKPFPDLNREALAYSLDLIDKKTSGQPIDVSGIDSDKLERFNNAVQTADFSYLYSWAIEKIRPTDSEELVSTQGEWIKYDQGSDHMPLVSSLEGHGTGWCTAGESTAKAQLQQCCLLPF